MSKGGKVDKDWTQTIFLSVNNFLNKDEVMKQPEVIVDLI